MGRQLKVFSGTAIAPPAIARAVGQNHHVGQVVAYAVATSKAAAHTALTQTGLTISAAGLSVAVGVHVGALERAGLLAGPIVLVTHLNGGTVARIADDRSPVVIGQLATHDRGTTVIGQRRIADLTIRFVPADPS